jgi:hypothetical protein
MSRAVKPRHARVVQHVRAPRPRVERVLEGEPRIVGGAVVVERRARKPLLQEPWLLDKHLLRLERPVQLRRAEEAEAVVEPHAHVELEDAPPLALVDGEEEPERVHEVRRDVHEHTTLADALENQAQLALLQVAQPAVDELGAA